MTDSLTGGWTEGGAAFRTTLGVEGKSCLSLTYPCCMLVGTCLMVPVCGLVSMVVASADLFKCALLVFLGFWITGLHICSILPRKVKSDYVRYEGSSLFEFKHALGLHIFIIPD